MEKSPEIEAVLHGGGRATVTIDGQEHKTNSADDTAARREAMAIVTKHAKSVGRSLTVTTTDPTGSDVIYVDADGTISTTPPAPPKLSRKEKTARDTEQEQAEQPAPEPPPAPAAPAAPAATAAVAPSPETRTRRELREASSFLAEQTVTEPATKGMRGWLNTMGLRLAPSAEEADERADIYQVSRHFTGRRTVSIVNQKGGANKTPTVVNLAAVFARNGGAGVLTWDNNETMGNLGWRTDQASHDATVLDVLAHSEDLLSASAESGEIAGFVHHQPGDKFDVLRSDQRIGGNHEITAEEVDILHRVAAKYYRLIFMDSGNSDRAANWLRMIEKTDQLVVATTTQEDRAEGALLTLKGLDHRGGKAAELAAGSVVVVSEYSPNEPKDAAQKVADQFRPYVREVVTVPYDVALKSGRIRHSALQSKTQRAWLAAAAAVARGL